MKMRKITNHVFWTGAVDWDRRLFDALVPLPDGTSYNAYLIRGDEKTALVDTVDPHMADMLMDQLSVIPDLDYVVVNHAEQDHSGTLPQVLERYPKAQVVATSTAKKMLVDLLQIPETRITPTKDG
ncbi:MAG: MBL fold metallo-hydrolase, partial [Anaerolineae bacterium]|nr:MBL fold metallo-hydrolase [Anaerolineae bacterium]